MKKFVLFGLYFLLTLPYCNAQRKGGERSSPNRTKGSQRTTLNDFTLSNLLIKSKEIKRGGPPRDGIPSIDKPIFISAKYADYLKPDDFILGVEYNGITKAYPIRIMDQHEIVNDIYAGKKVAVTYCPLCGSGMAFEADGTGQLGVSGLLYNSDVLLYDRDTESLWSQIMGMSISGEKSGERLNYIYTQNTTWQEWKRQHPNTFVLSKNTGHKRNYSRAAYEGYKKNDRLMFPVNNKNKDLPNKERVVGIEINGKFRAYPYSELIKNKTAVEEVFNDKELMIMFDKNAKSATIIINGETYPSASMYWFAWFAFHPETSVYISGF